MWIGVARLIFAFALTAVVPAIFAQVQKAQPEKEETVFSEDESFKHPVPLPSGVAKVLLRDELASQALDEDESEAAEAKPAKFFRATEVHLGASDEVALLVIGIPPMSGADNGWFWVVRSPRKNPRVILTAGANSLAIMNTATNGYKDISTAWSSPRETHEVVYHFDGKRYRLWREKQRANPPEK